MNRKSRNFSVPNASHNPSISSSKVSLPPSATSMHNRKSKKEFEDGSQKRKSIARMTRSDPMFEQNRMNKPRSSDFFGNSDYATLFGSTSETNEDRRGSGKRDKQSEDGFDDHSEMLAARTSIIPMENSGSPSDSSSFVSISTVEGDSRVDQFHERKKSTAGIVYNRHNLKARASDLLFLKKRYLFPGIWEEDSEEEIDKATRIYHGRTALKDE